MKTPLIALFACMLALSGCMVAAYPEPATYPDVGYPGYVYSYPNGCWADDVWYAPCPWTPGPTYGYYLWYGGVYHFHAGPAWGYRPGLPPPAYWHHRYMPHGYRYAPPPRHYVPARPYPGPRGRRF